MLLNEERKEGQSWGQDEGEEQVDEGSHVCPRPRSVWADEPTSSWFSTRFEVEQRFFMSPPDVCSPENEADQRLFDSVLKWEWMTRFRKVPRLLNCCMSKNMRTSRLLWNVWQKNLQINVNKTLMSFYDVFTQKQQILIRINKLNGSIWF